MGHQVGDTVYVPSEGQAGTVNAVEGGWCKVSLAFGEVRVFRADLLEPLRDE